MIRVRFLSPLSEDKKDHSLMTNKQSTGTAKETPQDPVTSGGSLHLMLGSIGFGSTYLTTKVEKETRSKTNDSLLLKETTTITTQFNDIAFVLGEDYTFAWGLGAFGGGSLKTQAQYGYSGASDETLESNYVGGHSTFVVLGHHGSGFETLLGMRWNDIKAELSASGSSAETLNTAGTIAFDDKGIRFKTTQVQLGIGFTF